MFHFETFWIIL